MAITGVLALAVAAGAAGIEPELVSRSSFSVIGISVRTSNRAEADPETAKLPSFWRRFFEKVIPDKIPGKKRGGLIFGVYTNYESDHNGAYDLVAAFEADSLRLVSKGMVGATVPAGKYLVFHARGQMPEALIETWTRIWAYFANSSRYQRAYTTDFESYLEGNKVDIYIAIK